MPRTKLDHFSWHLFQKVETFSALFATTLLRQDKFWALKEYLLSEVNASCLPRFLQSSSSL